MISPTQRHDILTGSHEPTDEESHWPADEDDEGEEGKPGGCGYSDTLQAVLILEMW